jgi:IS30 family transposase
MNELPPEETALRDQRIAQLTLAGKSARQVAEEVGVTKRTVQRARMRTGVAKPPRQPLAGDEIRCAETLLDDGASYTEVARTLGRHPETIARNFPGRSTWNNGVEYRKFMAALDAIVPPIHWEVAS